jgi:hypothetical protein
MNETDSLTDVALDPIAEQAVRELAQQLTAELEDTIKTILDRVATPLRSELAERQRAVERVNRQLQEALRDLADSLPGRLQQVLEDTAGAALLGPLEEKTRRLTTALDAYGVALTAAGERTDEAHRQTVAYLQVLPSGIDGVLSGHRTRLEELVVRLEKELPGRVEERLLPALKAEIDRLHGNLDATRRSLDSTCGELDRLKRQGRLSALAVGLALLGLVVAVAGWVVSLVLRPGG